MEEIVIIATEGERKLVPSNFKNIIVTGVGAGNVIKTLQHLPRNTPLINIGYCGSNCIAIDTVCTIGLSRSFHPNIEFKEDEYKLDGEYTCYSNNDFVLHTDIKEPVVFDMELYTIMALGFTNVKAIKHVSDNLSTKQYYEKAPEVEEK